MDEREARKLIGVPPQGALSPVGGLSRDAMTALTKEAAKSVRPKKKDGTKRKRGGQPGNQNGVKSGIYSRTDRFEERFTKYSKALGKAGAQEEVALTRAMIMNVIDGKTPLGDAEIDDADLRAELIRDLMLLNLKAQDLALKQEAKRADMEAKAQGDKDMEVKLSPEAHSAMMGMVGAQASAEAAQTADELLAVAKERVAAIEQKRAAQGQEQPGGGE